MKKGVILLLVLLASCSPAYDNPNIIIIGLDAVRPDQVNNSTMPFLMNYSKHAYVFDNAVTQAPWTLPSFMTLFTGVYPSQHKLTNRYVLSPGSDALSEVELSQDITTLAEYLKARGYATAGFTGDSGVLGRYGYARGFDIYVDNITFGGFHDTVPMALQWMNTTFEPFFLFVHGYEAHGKFLLPEGFFSSEFDISPEKWEYYRNETIWKREFSMSPEEQAAWLEWYDEKLHRLDDTLKLLLDSIPENTIVVIMSDHGEAFYEHEMFDHGTSVYEEVARVVLYLKLPGKEGKHFSHQVGLIDVLPTLFEQIGGKCSQCMGGSLFEGRDEFIETDYLYDFYLRAIRTQDNWKLIYNMETDEWELYNLDQDPGEETPLNNPDKFNELRNKLQEFISLSSS